MTNNRPIGFIDSGVGGLTVVKEAIKQLPNESILYLGDTARCPYGPRPAEQVIEYTWQMTRFLLEKNIKMLVIACNTATAVALEEIKEQLTIPVIGVILPGSRAAVKASKNQRIGVIGTNGTIKSDSYKRALRPLIQNELGAHIQLIDSGAETVGEVSTLLDYFSIAATSQDDPHPQHAFFTTGSPKMFDEIANDWLDLDTISSIHTDLGGF